MAWRVGRTGGGDEGGSCVARYGVDWDMIPNRKRSIRLTVGLWGRRFGAVRMEVVHISSRDVCVPNCYTIDAMECREAHTYIR